MQQLFGMKAKYMTLYVFKSNIFKALLLANKIHRPGRKPSRCSNSSSKISRKTPVVKPITDVSYDNVAHVPVHAEAKSRCKLGIKSYSRIMCEKCNVSLCLNINNNRFKAFHMK